MRPMSVAALVILTLVLAACGSGGSLSASEYRRQLDAACAKLMQFNASLPKRMKDEHLDIEQAQQLADDNGRAFVQTIHDLDPPDELQEAHQRLLDQGDAPTPSGDDQAELRRWILGFADRYADLGATGCEKGERAVAAQIPA